MIKVKDDLQEEDVKPFVVGSQTVAGVPKERCSVLLFDDFVKATNTQVATVEESMKSMEVKSTIKKNTKSADSIIMVYETKRYQKEKRSIDTKCREGDKLLVCKTTTCSMIVHKNYMGASVQLNAKLIFISKGIRKEAVEHVHESGRQKCTFSRKSYKCEHTSLTVNEENKDRASENSNKVGNFPFERSQQQVPISVIHSPPFREKENVNNGLAGDVRKEADCEMMNTRSLTGERVEDKEMETDQACEHGNKFFSCNKLKIVSTNESNDEKVLQNMTEHNMDGTVEPIWAHKIVDESIDETLKSNKVESHVRLMKNMPISTWLTRHKNRLLLIKLTKKRGFHQMKKLPRRNK
ncbi:hypothetical protein RYX36_021237 [Vicia faba]